MYRYLDQEVAAQSAGARFIIENTRKWVAAISERKCPAHAIASDFLANQMIGGIGAFHKLLGVLATRASISLGFATQGCARSSTSPTAVTSAGTERRSSRAIRSMRSRTILSSLSRARGMWTRRRSARFTTCFRKRGSIDASLVHHALSEGARALAVLNDKAPAGTVLTEVAAPTVVAPPAASAENLRMALGLI